MEGQIILHRPWTCRWGRFGDVVGPAAVYWSCAHPALPDGPQLLGSDACSACPRWTASSRMGDRLEDAAGGRSAGGIWFAIL